MKLQSYQFVYMGIEGKAQTYANATSTITWAWITWNGQGGHLETYTPAFQAVVRDAIKEARRRYADQLVRMLAAERSANTGIRRATLNASIGDKSVVSLVKQRIEYAVATGFGSDVDLVY